MYSYLLNGSGLKKSNQIKLKQASQKPLHYCHRSDLCKHRLFYFIWWLILPFLNIKNHNVLLSYCQWEGCNLEKSTFLSPLELLPWESSILKIKISFSSRMYGTNMAVTQMNGCFIWIVYTNKTKFRLSTKDCSFP